MAKITGIGGVFFKAKDMTRMTEWYRDTLGLPIGDQPYVPFEWRDKENSDQTGQTVWSLFPSDTTYFDPSTASQMINYIVDDLDGMLNELKAKSVQVVGGIEEMDEIGRFAWVIDPEGNKIELWEPSKP